MEWCNGDLWWWCTGWSGVMVICGGGTLDGVV